MEPNYQQRLCQQCEQRGVPLTPTQCAQLLQYLDLLLRWRPHLSLTGLRDAERMLDVLIIASLDFVAGHLLAPGLRVLDLGTGAGVPGIPLAICCPEVHVTLLDRSAKKVTFLHRVVASLQLTNCQPWCGTAEERAQRVLPHTVFDVVVSRGVGTIAHLMRLAAPLVTPGGRLLLRKPVQTPEVQEAASLLAPEAWASLGTRPLPWGVEPWELVVLERGRGPQAALAEDG